MATIEWTPEQAAERERQKAANPPDRRIHVELTPEQREAWRQAAEEEQANKEETIARFHRMQAAEKEPGFLGDLRRAINASGHRTIKLPEEIGVEARLLGDFRTGEADLPADAIARLVDVLHLRLMQEIPASQSEIPNKATA